MRLQQVIQAMPWAKLVLDHNFMFNHKSTRKQQLLITSYLYISFMILHALGKYTNIANQYNFPCDILLNNQIPCHEIPNTILNL